MNAKHLVSTTATPRTCTCGAPILTAHDEGLPARVDATPIPIGDEIATLLTGRRTYTHTWIGQLIHRTPGRIASRRLDHHPIHAEHRCPPKQPQDEQLTLGI